MIYDSYVKTAIKTMESQFTEEDKHLKLITKSPLLSGYRPEFDVSEILGSDAGNWIQNLIVILNCIVELDRVDIIKFFERLYI